MLSFEKRMAIAVRMKGNRHAAGKRATYRFRPSVAIGHKLADMIAANNCPVEIHWRSGGRAGISTNDAEFAAAWVTKVQELGFKVRNAAPQRTTKLQRLGVTHQPRQRCAECDCGDGPCNWIRPIGVDELGEPVCNCQSMDECDERPGCLTVAEHAAQCAASGALDALGSIHDMIEADKPDTQIQEREPWDD